MSTDKLGSVLRSLRKAIAERATFRNGVVVEMLDATHVLVDIGKPVPAFCSPIFLPAVVVGTPVTVRVQGSQYTVSNAPQSTARLVTGAEMDSILARLTALEPVITGPNLIPNPEPALETGWWTDAYSGGEYRDYFGPQGVNFYSFYFYPENVAWSTINTGPTAIADVAVSAGMTYSVSCYAQETWSGYGWTPRSTVQAGVIWHDSTSTEISTALGDPLSLAAVSVPWVYPPDSVAEDDPTAEPSGSFLAPTGAAYGRPFARIVTNNGESFHLSNFDMHRTA